jgi:hypothetical protein
LPATAAARVHTAATIRPNSRRAPAAVLAATA